MAGDPEYGTRRTRSACERQFLHAARLAFDHPVSGERIEVGSALPDDLEGALRWRLNDGRRPVQAALRAL